MTVYEVSIRNQKGQWLKISGGMTHQRVAKAKEELEKAKLCYPEAFVAGVWYTPQADGSLWRRPLGACTSLAWLQPSQPQPEEKRRPNRNVTKTRHLKSL